LALVHGQDFGKWDYVHFDQFTAETMAAQTERNPDCPLCGTYGCCGAGDPPEDEYEKALPPPPRIPSEISL